MSFKNIPDNIRKLVASPPGPPDEEAIKLFKVERYGWAVSHILNRLSPRDRLDFYFYALTKVPLRAYKQGVELLKIAVETVYTTGDSGIAEEYRKNFHGFGSFDNVANAIITEALPPFNMDEAWRICLVDAIYGIHDPMDREGYAMALSDLLEFKFNNTTFRLMYGKS